MGFIKAFAGSISGTFGDQWKDYYRPATIDSTTAAIIPMEKVEENAGRGVNTHGYDNIITNGSKIQVPANYALVTMQDGGITGFIAEEGGFIWQSDDPNSKSLFSGGGLLSSTIGSSWEKFKFGGIPGSEQHAFYVNLKEIAGIRFGTTEPINWYDNFFETRVGATANGTYSIKIVDPLLFIKGFVPQSYLNTMSKPYDFNDIDNESAEQLFNEFVESLSMGFTKLSVEAKTQGMDTLDYVSINRSNLGRAVDQVLEESKQWRSGRGLEVVNVAIPSLSYDQATLELLKTIQTDDAEVRKAKRMGQAYGDNMAGMMAAASGQAMQSAASNENGAMMGFMGMNFAQQQGNSMLGTVSGMQPQTPVQPAQPMETATTNVGDDTERLLNAKKLLEAGAITQEDYDKLKSQILGI